MRRYALTAAKVLAFAAFLLFLIAAVQLYFEWMRLERHIDRLFTP